MKGTLTRGYRQLTEENRIEIYAMRQAGKQQKQIALALGGSALGILLSTLAALWTPQRGQSVVG